MQQIVDAYCYSAQLCGIIDYKEKIKKEE